MYSKDELLSKDVAELESIAGQLGAKIKSGDSQEDIVYSILDKQAEVEGSKNPLGTKRRRVRIVKKDTDRVYSVNGKEGENFDLKKTKLLPKFLLCSMMCRLRLRQNRKQQGEELRQKQMRRLRLTLQIQILKIQ